MPEGSKVDKIFQALKAQGHSVESAARIAQSVSGQSLATGRPPRKTVRGVSETSVQRRKYA